MMMKRTRSILAALLAIVMLCSLLPVSVLAASEYTASISAGSTEVSEGETVSISVDISSGTEATYNSAYLVLTYNPGVFEFQAAASTLNGFGCDAESGKLTLSRYGTDAAVSVSPDLVLSFAAKASGSGEFSLSTAKVDKAANAAVADAPDASIGAGCSVSVSAQTYTVAITLGDYMTASGGALTQTVAAGTAIETITVTADDTHVLRWADSNEYSAFTNAGLSVLSGTDPDTGNFRYTFSGTPTASVSLRLVTLDRPSEPIFSVNGTALEYTSYQQVVFAIAADPVAVHATGPITVPYGAEVSISSVTAVNGFAYKVNPTASSWSAYSKPFTITADRTIYAYAYSSRDSKYVMASFRLERFNLSPSGENMTISADYYNGTAYQTVENPGEAPQGATITVSGIAAAPDGKYLRLTYSYTDGDGDHTVDISDAKSFTMPGAAVAVKAEYLDATQLVISNEEELRAFADSVNSGNDYFGYTVTLDSDIELTGSWTAAGPFQGTFDGQGHTISGLDDSLFLSLGSTATVKNVTVSGAIQGKDIAGGIAASASPGSWIENCVNRVNITGNGLVAGGILGKADNYAGNSEVVTIIGCANYGEINEAPEITDPTDLPRLRDSYAGGIVGWANIVPCVIEQCANYGDVSSGFAAGGILGYNGQVFGTTTINSCVNRGNISVVAYYNAAAGIMGWSFTEGGYEFLVSNCYNLGDIYVMNNNGSGGASGIVTSFYAEDFGQLPTIHGAIKNCYNMGTAISENGSNGHVEVRQGEEEIFPSMLGAGGHYSGYYSVNSDDYVTRTNCWYSTQTFTAEELGSAFKSGGNVQTTPLLVWESDEPDTGSYPLTFDVTGPAAYTATVTQNGTVCQPSGENTWALQNGEYEYTVSAQGYISESGTFRISSNGRTVKVTLTAAAVVSIEVKPANASLALVDADGSAIAPDTAANGVYTFTLKSGNSYTYTASADGYLDKSGSFVAADGGSISVELTEDAGVVTIPASVSEFHITQQGSYQLEQGFTGIVYVDTTEPATLIGTGTSESNVFSGVTVLGTVAGIDLTVQDLFIRNSDPSTEKDEGDAAIGRSVIDVTGKGNTLRIAGTNLLESTTYVQSALIHVGPSAELTFVGDGTLYLYKYTQGAGIGGNANEACGEITFESGAYYIKGSKTGAVIGGDATDGSINGDITISGGTLDIEANAKGAAIGASNIGSCAGNVYLTGGTVTITTDFSGSAIGYGGSQAGSPGTLIVTGGSLKTYVTKNAAASWGLPDAAISDVNITAAKRDASGAEVYRLVFDASVFTGESITVKLDGANHTFYQGGLHKKDYNKSAASTIANWVDSSDANLYFYLTGKDHTLSVTDGTTTKTYNVTWTGSEFIYSEAGVTSYTVTFTGEHGAKALVNGTAQSAASVAEGDSLTFGTTAETGYEVTAAALAGNTGTLTKNSDGTWTLSGVTADTEVILTAGPKAYAVEFAVTPTNATVLVIDSKGNTVTGTNNIFSLLYGETYTYTVSAEGYTSRNGELTPGDDFTEDQTGGNAIPVTLSKSSEAEGEEYTVVFKPTPADANIIVKDEKGNLVAGENGSFKLKAGTYSYSVLRDGYETRSASLEVTEDATVEITLIRLYTVVFDLTPATAAVTVKDASGNEVAGEGQSYQLREGQKYTYTVSADGYQSRSGDFAANEDRTISVALLKEETADKTYKVTFQTTPEDAKVEVTDASGSAVAGEDKVFELKDGDTYTYTVSAEGYKTFSKSITPGVEFTADYTVTVSLAKEEQAEDKTYKVTFLTTPEDAKVAVTDASGSAVAGEDKVFELKDGVTYTYTVSAEGYKTHTSTLTPGVEFTEDHTVTVTLAKEATDKTYKVTFLTTPTDATVTVVDASGSPVAGDGKVFELKDGETYTYTVSAEGYESLSAEVIPGLDFTEDCTYTVELPKKAKTYKVEFKLSPESATIKVCDEIGELVGENNIYQLEEGVTYTYTVSAEGYKTKSGDLIPGVDFDSDQVGENAIEISLSKDESNSASENTSSIWDGESIDTSWEGDGSEENPYKISSAAELAGLAAAVNAVGPGNTAFRNTWFKLTKDIDLDNYEWTSIGGGEAQCGFGGHFDGGGHVVSGLYIRSTVSWTEYGGRNRGLFGIIDAGGVVENLGVDGYVYAQRSVGGIAGKNSGTIRRCYNAADIYATDSKGVGGICGANWNQGTITDCYNVGSVTSYYASGSAGGIAGENEYRIERCYNIGDVTSPLNAGGIVGSDKHTGGGASAGAVGTGVCYDCYYLEGTVVGAYTGGIGFEAEDAKNTVTAVSTEELKELPKGLGSAFTKDTERLNGGYPILRWQSVSAEGSEEEDEIIAWIEPGGVILGVETDEYGNADAKLREKDAKEGLKVSENKEQLTVEVLSEDAHRIVLDVEHHGMTAIAEADVSLRIVTGRGTITLDKDTIDALIESGYEVRFVVEAKQDGRTRLFITVDHRLSDVMMKVEIPGAEDGQVLVTVNSEGVEEIVKKSVVEGGKAYADLPSGTTVKLVSNQKQFEDVGPKDWFKSAVDFVSGHELFQGTGNGLFEPNSQMTRAMMVTVLYRLEGKPEITEKIAFNDVPDGQWYTDAVAWASGTGIVQGYGEGLFGTNDPITREQMAVILYHYVTWLGLDTSSVEGDLSGFTDGDAVSDWAVEAMRWAVGVGLFQGDDTGALDPGDTATRAEVATLYERLVRMLVM